MKTLAWTAAFVIALPLLASAADRTDAARTSWARQVKRDLARREYAPTADGAGGFTAINRAHGLEATFDAGGVVVRPRATADARRSDAWGASGAWGLRLRGVGRGSDVRPAGIATPVCDGARVEYHRAGLVEWYVNDARGIEQGFSLTAPPPRDAAPSPGDLVLELEVLGTLEGRPDGAGVSFCTGDGTIALRYDHLVVLDAGGARLDAALQLDGRTLRIRVDDGGARYPILVDPLTFDPAWDHNGGLNAFGFGWSAAGAGDVNGDGFEDLIVGAPASSNGEGSEGRVYGYYGSAFGLSTTPDWIVESNVKGAELGRAVAGAGDVNGDGYDDVIAGATYYTNGQQFEGAAYVYLGSATGLATTPAWFVESNVGGATFGEGVGGAGDVNGDGFDDVVVGAPSAFGMGRAYLYLGSATGLGTTPAWTANGPVAGGAFGRSVDGAGDVNGDGRADVIVGAHTYANGENHEGGAFLFLGIPAGLTPGFVWSAESDAAGALFGLAVAGAGDVNGDGLDDVIVGAPYFSSTLLQEGRAFEYLGTPSGLAATPAWIATGQNYSAAFGYAVGCAGDVNGDGFDDVVVGAPNYKEASVNEGRAFVFLGSSGGTEAIPSWSGYEASTHGYLGYSVAGAGDVNGDGFDDVVAAGQNLDNGYQHAFLYLGGPYAAAAPYGFGKPLPQSQNVAPRLTSLSAPVLGGVATLRLSKGTPGATPAFLFTGIQPAMLPFDDSVVLVNPFAVTVLPGLSGSGAFQLIVPIPALPALQGFEVYFQAGFVNPAAPGPYHTLLSNAEHWTLGT